MSNMKWQPIETAPLDGTPVLVVDDEEDKGDGCVYIATYSSLSRWTLDTSPQVEGHPTHWMPLPGLPARPDELTDETREGLVNSLSAIAPGLSLRGEKKASRYMYLAQIRIMELEREVKELRAWAEMGKMSHDMIERQGHVCVFDHSVEDPRCGICGKGARDD